MATKSAPPGDESTAPASPLATFGILADTHIPDRVRSLHPAIIPAFRAAGVRRVLHAGDISSSQVLEALREVAPVTAVMGNRDMFVRRLKRVETLTECGVRVMLTHGHGNWFFYLWDKWRFWLTGYRLSRYLPVLERYGFDSQVIVFGHTHHVENRWRDGRLLFNPGSASFGFPPHGVPSIGLLHFYPGQAVAGEIITLSGWRIERGFWVPA